MLTLVTAPPIKQRQHSLVQLFYFCDDHICCTDSFMSDTFASEPAGMTYLYALALKEKSSFGEVSWRSLSRFRLQASKVNGTP